MSTALVTSLRYPRAWFCAGLLIAVTITILSLLPAQRLPQIDVSDKIRHGFAYLVLGFWFASVIARRDWLFVFLGLLALGGAIEIAQGLMKLGREADVADLTANAGGAAVGVLFAATPIGRWPAMLERLVSRGP